MVVACLVEDLLSKGSGSGSGAGLRLSMVNEMLSHPAQPHGRGWGYRIHDALDKTSRIVGALVIGLVVFLAAGIRTAYVCCRPPRSWPWHR